VNKFIHIRIARSFYEYEFCGKGNVQNCQCRF